MSRADPWPLDERKTMMRSQVEKIASFGGSHLDKLSAVHVASTYGISVGEVEAEITKHQLAREGGDK